MSRQLLDAALTEHRSGNLVRAAALYRQTLDDEPDNADALHLLGVVSLQSGDHDDAVDLIGRAIEQRPDAAAFHGNLGEALRAAGRMDDAVAAYREAVRLAPGFADAYGNLGLALSGLGRHDEALGCLERAVSLNPQFLEAHMNLGGVLKELGRLEDAARCFARAIEIDPNLAEAHVNLGNALKSCGQPEQARKHYEHAIALRPAMPQTYGNLALLLIDEERFDDARDAFQHMFELTHGNALWNAPVFTPSAPAESTSIRTTRFALVNAAEQIEYLLATAKLDRSFEQMAAAYRSVLSELDEEERDAPFTLGAAHCTRIGAFFGQVVRFVDAPRIDGPAVNPKLDFRAIEDAYLASPLAVVNFDDFLTPPALEALYRFCLESTIFLGQARGGYLSSYMGSGFHCSLMFQIAEELKACFPRLLGGQSIGNMWVYRYPSEGEGVRAHTDEGSVTFNFWISPSSGNLDPDGGGLLVYTKEQPLEWDFVRMNLDKDDPSVREEIDRFLSDAEVVRVAYACNRALLFHSNLFHKSDRFRFHDDYLSRRMNVTLLFGQRGTDIRLRYV